MMKLENIFNNSISANKSDIEEIITKNGIIIDGYFTINDDGSIDVEGNVKFSKKAKLLQKLSLKLNKVSGYFDCSYNQLTLLEFAPKKVGGAFVFDNILKDVSKVNSYFYKVILLYRIDEDESLLPAIIKQNHIHLKVIFRYQHSNYYNIWNDDLSLNNENWNTFHEDILDRLQ